MTKSKSSKKKEAEEAIKDDVEAVEELPEPSDAEDKVEDKTVEDAEVTAEETDAEDAPVEQAALEDQIETADPTPPVVEQKVVVQKAGFFPTLVAGVLAAGAGFLGAQYSSQSWPFEPGPSTDPLAVAQGAQETAAQAEEAVRTLEAALAEQAGAEQDVADQIAALADQIAGLGERIDTLEARPTEPGAPIDLGGLEGEVQTLQSQLADLMAEANIAEQSAAAAAQRELARAALGRVQASLETGAPFASALQELSENTDLSIPPALGGIAADGAPALSDLQESFDDAARAALAAARASGTEESGNFGDRVGAFLLARTGARSVEPREGDDPDAVLSRVGASVSKGNLGDALAEAETLPEAARTAMADWLNAAETRQSALNAADALSQELTN